MASARAVHLNGAVYFDFELCSPCILKAPPSREIAGRVMPRVKKLVSHYNF